MISCDALILVEVSKANFEMVPRDYLNTPRSNFLPQQPTKEHFWGFLWLHIVTQGATVYPLYASSHCASRSYSLPQQQLGEEQDGGSRGSLETRITEWLAQTFQGQCHDESSLSWGVIALHNVQISAIIQAASWSLGMWWRRSLPRHYIHLLPIVHYINCCPGTMSIAHWSFTVPIRGPFRNQGTRGPFVDLGPFWVSFLIPRSPISLLKTFG